MNNTFRFIALGLLVGLLLVRSPYADAQAVRYVKPTASGTGDGSSWINASGNLQAMLNNSVFLDEVRIAQGLYYPTLDQDGNVNNGNPRRRTFTIPTGIKVRGGYAGTGANPNQRLTAPSSTTLSGDLGVVGNTADNAYHVVTMPNALSTILDGVVITGGNANTVVSGYGTRDIYGGGILLLNLAQDLVTPLLYQVFLVNNQAIKGAGLANFGGTLDGNTLVRASNPRLQNCLIENNAATNNGGGIFNTGNASPQLTSCVFRQNTSAQSGGGMCSENSASQPLTMNPTLTGCIFESNSAIISGGGIANIVPPNTAMSSLLDRCQFTGNVASPEGVGSGGAISNRTAGGALNLTVRNTWLFNNQADRGGAIFSNTTSTTANVGVQLINSTVYRNRARVAGGVYHQNISTVIDDLPTLSVQNTILWSNSATANLPGIAAYGYVLPIINFSDVQDCDTQSWCASGLRNLDVNPGLGGDNLTPAPTSPVLNLGNPYSTTAETGSADLNGYPRIQGGQIDMGALETDVPQTTIVSFTSGTWDNPYVWNCYCIPKVEQAVLLRHEVQIPANYAAFTLKVQYTPTGKLRFASPRSRLSMTPGVSF